MGCDRKIVKVQETFFGTKKYYVRLVGVDKLICCQPSDLSRGVVKTHEEGLSTAKNAKTRVNRVFFETQRKFLELQNEKNQRSPPDPLKTSKRLVRWIQVAQAYVVGVNQVLSSPKAERRSKHQEVLAYLNPCKFVLENLGLTRFVDGTFVKCLHKQNVFSMTDGKPGYLTCVICEKQFKWHGCVRTRN